MGEPTPHTIALTAAQQQLVERLLASRRYARPGDVVEAALKLLDEAEKRRAEQVEELRRDIAEGIAAAERGDLLDGEDVMEEWRRLDEDEGDAVKRRTA